MKTLALLRIEANILISFGKTLAVFDTQRPAFVIPSLPSGQPTKNITKKRIPTVRPDGTQLVSGNRPILSTFLFPLFFHCVPHPKIVGWYDGLSVLVPGYGRARSTIRVTEKLYVVCFVHDHVVRRLRDDGRH